MKHLRSIPLRVLLPALLLLCAAIAGLVSWQLDTRTLGHEIEAQFLEEARLRASDLQSLLEYRFRRSDFGGVNIAVSAAATRNDVLAAFVLDSHDQVVTATRWALVGQAAEATGVELPTDLRGRHAAQIAQVRASVTGSLVLSRDRQVAVAYYPLLVEVDDHALRARRNGLLVLVFDMRIPKARAFHGAGRQALDNALGFGGLAAFAWVFLHFRLTRRVAGLVASTRQLASGDLTARSGMAGSDELAQVGKAFDSMADRLAADILRREQVEAELRESRRFAESIAENSTSIIYLFDLETRRTVYTNRNAAESLGYAQAQISELGENLLPTIIHPEDLPRITRQQAHFAKVTDGRVFDLEFRVKGARGDWRWTWSREAVFSRRPSGAAWQILGTALDITDRKAAEDARLESERFLQSTLDALSSHIAILDEQGVILEVNGAWNRFADENHGKNRLRGIGDNYLDLCDAARGPFSEEASPMAAGIRAVIAGSTAAFELEYPCHSPVEERWFIARVTRFSGRGAVRVVVAHENISARKRAELALKGSEELLRRVMDSSQDCIKILSLEGRLLWMNEGGQRIMEVDAFETLRNRVWADLWPEEDRGAALESLAMARRHGVGTFSGFCPTAKGSPRWWEVVVTPILNDEGRPEKILSVSRDITARKEVENAVVRAKEAAESSNRAKSEFLANMSHEIRTPLNGILGMTDLVLESELTAEQRDYLGMAKTSGHALLRLINDILDFSKIEAGKLELEKIDFNLRDTIEHLLKPLVVRGEQKGLQVRAEIAEEVREHLLGDPLRLRQVLINFTDNALKFTEHGSVVVKVVAEGEGDAEQCLRFSITDTGIGIPLERQQAIFEAFAQVDGSTTRHYGGTGLGLAIVSQLVEQMRGRVWIESVVGSGTTFHFTAWFGVGQAPAPVDATAPLLLGPEIPGPAAGAPEGLRILLAEDNVINRALATALLVRRGHSLVHAANGREAVQLAGTGLFDLILMDVQMPEMDGFEATRLIREREQTGGGAPTPIVAMTAHAMAGDREWCLAAGMDEYLSKPLQKDELCAMLSRFAAAPSASRERAALQTSAQPSDPKALPVFSREKLLEQVDGDESLLRRLITLFHENTPRLLDDIRSSIAHRNAHDLGRSAHALLSSLGAFGAAHARHLTQELEAHAVHENYGNTPGTFAALERETVAIYATLTAFAAT